ncbi:MAG: DUF3048 domain-containing protein [Alkalicoccus sp.]|nr:MAG: DUF3048 domain-containing protein [Alkalicoccus sp.]
MKKVSGLHLWSGFLLLALLTACSDNNEENDNTAEEEAGYTAPLTGIPSDEELNHRTFGVMLGNSIDARPQTGLHEADIVYELLVEGNVTRLLALYHSTRPEEMGPVRSARSYYIDLGNGYDTIFASAGGSPDALDMMERGEVDYLSGLAFEGTYFQRSQEREAPHNLYTSYENLEAAVEETGYEWEREPEALTFTEEVPEEWKEAGEVSVSYGGSMNVMEFHFEDEAEGYVRSAGGQENQDPAAGEPAAPRNVLIVESSHKVIDDSGRREIDTESGGPAYLFQDGHVQKLEWENNEGRLLPVHDGEVVPFLPGMTWISFVPEDLEEHVSYE